MLKQKREHNKILEKVLSRTRSFGVNFNQNKCKFLVQEIKYVGHIFNQFGINPENDKIKALSVDSSKNGLGAVVLHKERPVVYASKSLSETQERYSQIEKETLAILFGCKRFHQYLYGKKFVVESDHQPLQKIVKKTFDKIPFRLQRIILALQDYDFAVKFNSRKHIFCRCIVTL